MQKRILVALAGLMVLAALVVLFIAPASAQDQPLPNARQAPLAQATAVPTTAPTVKPTPPVAVLKIVPVIAAASDPNVVTGTLKYVTDTTVGPATMTLYLGATGLPNVSIGFPVHVSASVADPKNPAKKFAWTLAGPVGTKATVKDPAAADTEFTPDVAGIYKVDVVASNDGGSGPMASVQINAGTYIGVTAGNCKQCHTTEASEWAKTAHATKFQREINGGTDPASSHYSESCARCHTVGYVPGVDNGGFAAVQAKLGYKFPEQKQIQAGKSWDSVPPELQNVANIQCENCHGPAKEHVTNGAPVMAASVASGSCNVCHGGREYLSLQNSAHTEETAAAWNEPTGPSRQACVRCHSAEGYVSFTKDPKNQASWNNTKEALGCSTCHDPHSDKNPKQLRVVGKPLEVPFDNPKDVGLSATCETCHNSRTKAADAVKGSYPHYSSAAEFLNNTGGVTYGQTIADSPHGQIVGASPVPDPSDKTGKTMLYGGATPGPCVTCHMAPTLADTKDPNVNKVGAHSFNLVSPDGKTDLTAACTSCHGQQKTFNFTAKADYDGNGKVEGVQDEVKGLLNVVWKALEAKGFKKVDTGYPYATVPQDADDKAKNAWYNFRTVYGVMWGTETGNGNEGKAQAIHNFKRSVELLQLSYKDLTGSDIPNATVLK